MRANQLDWEEKVIKVYLSCKTMRQLEIAKKWANDTFFRNYFSAPSLAEQDTYQAMRNKISNMPRYY